MHGARQNITRRIEARGIVIGVMLTPSHGAELSAKPHSGNANRMHADTLTAGYIGELATDTIGKMFSTLKYNVPHSPKSKKPIQIAQLLLYCSPIIGVVECDTAPDFNGTAVQEIQ